MASAPGPQVGRLAIVPIILPPVACRADRAAFKAGSNAGSGFLIWEKIDGMRLRRDVMTSLVRIGCEQAFTSLIGREWVPTWIRKDRRTGPHSEEQRALPGQS